MSLKIRNNLAKSSWHATSYHNRLARQSSGPELAARLRALPITEELRTAAASLVWWDMVDRTANPKEFTAAFDEWLHPREPVGEMPAEEVAAVLVALGYEESGVGVRVAHRPTVTRPRERQRGPNRRRNHGIAA